MKKLIITVVLILIASVVLFFVLPPISTLTAFFNDLSGTSLILAVVLFFFIQTLFTVILCFVPGTSMGFIALGIAVFHSQHPIIIFAITLTGVVVSSEVLYLVGRYGGRRLAVKFLGEKDITKAEHLLVNKTKVYLPMMYMLPIFPDDALCMVAGIIKLNHLYHFIVLLIFRGIGVAMIVFLGSDPFGYSSFTLSDWFVFITACAFWLTMLVFFGNKLDKKLSK